MPFQLDSLVQTGKVAVYGSLREGLGNHRVIQGAKKIGTTRVQGFDMYSMSAFPFVTHGTGEITVEVYEVPDLRYAQGLDGLEGYPSFYDREVIETEFGEAWLYFIDGNNLELYEPVPDGDWVEFLQAREAPVSDSNSMNHTE